MNSVDKYELKEKIGHSHFLAWVWKILLCASPNTICADKIQFPLAQITMKFTPTRPKSLTTMYAETIIRGSVAPLYAAIRHYTLYARKKA